MRIARITRAHGDFVIDNVDQDHLMHVMQTTRAPVLLPIRLIKLEIISDHQTMHSDNHDSDMTICAVIIYIIFDSKTNFKCPYPGEAEQEIQA